MRPHLSTTGVKATPGRGWGRVQGWLACRASDLFHREAGGWFWAHLKCSRGPSRSGVGSEPPHPDRSPEEGDCWPRVE